MHCSTLSAFSCKSAISLKGLGKLGLLINEAAPRQVSDLLDLRCPAVQKALAAWQWKDQENGKTKKNPISSELHYKRS